MVGYRSIDAVNWSGSTYTVTGPSDNLDTRKEEWSDGSGIYIYDTEGTDVPEKERNTPKDGTYTINVKRTDGSGK